jgi:hypothetical protein
MQDPSLILSGTYIWINRQTRKKLFRILVPIVIPVPPFLPNPTLLIHLFSEVYQGSGLTDSLKLHDFMPKQLSKVYTSHYSDQCVLPDPQGVEDLTYPKFIG